MATLYLGSSRLTGSLPAEWGNPFSFQKLSTLSLTNSTITGTPLLVSPPAKNVYATCHAMLEVMTIGAKLFPCNIELSDLGGAL